MFQECSFHESLLWQDGLCGDKDWAILAPVSNDNKLIWFAKLDVGRILSLTCHWCPIWGKYTFHISIGFIRFFLELRPILRYCGLMRRGKPKSAYDKLTINVDSCPWDYVLERQGSISDLLIPNSTYFPLLPFKDFSLSGIIHPGHQEQCLNC